LMIKIVDWRFGVCARAVTLRSLIVLKITTLTCQTLACNVIFRAASRVDSPIAECDIGETRQNP
jgi:hypothetical protein